MTDLIKLGLPREYLETIYRRSNQKVAWKMNGKRNSPILFDTEELEKVRIAACKAR
jgi:hypothetical protein